MTTHPVTTGDGWTIFNLRHAHVSVGGFITWDIEPKIGTFTAENQKAADVIRYPAAWVDCDVCGKRLQFTVTPDTRISLPWEIGGWRIDWIGEVGVSVLCPDEALK